MIVGAIAVTVAALVPLAWNRFEAWAVGIHQKSTTRELAAWEQEFSQIRSKDEAVRAVDMLRYIQGYYIPGPGYRGTSVTEATLETQRRNTSATLVKAHEEFTGERHGLDVDKWEEWRDGHSRQ